MKKRRHYVQTPGERKKWLPFIIAVLLVIAISGVIVIRLFLSSLFFSSKDRLNVVFYGKNAVYYSLGKYDRVDYFISFYPDVKISVPGGYGMYRIGGLGKLVSLEKNPDILRKAFSVTTSSTVDRYFYHPSQEIYYGQERVTQESLNHPGFRDIFFSASDANMFDRLYIFLQFVQRTRDQYEEIDYRSYMGNDEEFFQDKDFLRRYQGYLYNKLYRKEQKTVQILYKSSYKTALYLSRIIEGDGIRVVDLSEYEGSGRGEGCQVTENSEVFSESAKAIAGFFNCALTKGKTVSSDIIMKLGDSESSWEVL